MPASSHEAQFIPNAPGCPPFLADITSEEVKGTKIITFASTPPANPPKVPAMHTIDGRKFDGEVGAVVLLNNVEEWKVVNETYGPPIAHPFHIHINPFQVVEVFNPNATVTDPSTQQQIPKYVFVDGSSGGGSFNPAIQCKVDINDQDTWKDCHLPAVNKNLIWWDVFPIPSGKAVKIGNKTVKVPGYFKMRSRFVDYFGYYVLHCHILAHEDRGMMTVVEVAPARSPYSHH